MLINLSNHPSEFWTDKQLKTAFKEFDNMVEDILFPAVDPFSSEADIQKLADDFVQKCENILSNHIGENNAVHIMGELTFCFSVISILLSKGIKCISSTTDRTSEETNDGVKFSKFNFVKFREYKL
jgi:hypothetical protein